MTALESSIGSRVRAWSVAAAFCCAPVAAAQLPPTVSLAPPAAAPQVPACMRDFPDDSLVPAVLVLHASELTDLDSTARARVAEIDLFTQMVAERYRAKLNGTPGRLPSAEPASDWRTREHGAMVTVHRDGRFTSRPFGSNLYDQVEGSQVVRPGLLGAILDSLRAEGELLSFSAGAVDSVKFDLLLSSVQLDGAVMRPFEVRTGFPVATLRVPPGEEARPLVDPQPHYPRAQIAGGYEGSILMEFVVDTTGRVLPNSIHDLWPRDTPRLTGQAKGTYDGFVQSVHDALLEARYVPARYARCLIPQTMRQPFTFGLRR